MNPCDFGVLEEEDIKKKLTRRKANQQVIQKNVEEADLERWVVAQLPCVFETKLKPSETIQKLSTKRQEKHKEALRQMKSELNEINLKTEKNIRISGEEVKAFFDAHEKELEDILNSANVAEVVTWPGSALNTIYSQVSGIKEQQKALIEELYVDYLKFEEERQKLSMLAVQKGSENLKMAAWLPPYELQTMLETEIMDMNKLILNNHRSYADLKLHLVLYTEQVFREFSDKIECIQERWLRYRVVQACQEACAAAEAKPHIPDAITRLEVAGTELNLQLTPDGFYSTCQAQTWIENVNKAMKEIRMHVKSLVSALQQSLEFVLKSLRGAVDDLNKDCNYPQVLTISSRVVQPIIFEIEAQRLKDIQCVEMFWQDILNEIKVVADAVTKVLKDSTQLWARHDERVNKAQKLALLALDKCQAGNLKGLEKLETKLDTQLEELKKEYIPPKLEKTFTAVKKTLDAINKKIEQSLISEERTIDSFNKYVQTEDGILSAELKTFLNNVEWEENNCLDQRNTRNYPESTLYKKMVTIREKICDVQNWKLGLWNTLQEFSTVTRPFLETKARDWVKEKCDKLKEDMEIKTTRHNLRYDEVNANVFKLRKAQITNHTARLEAYKAKVEEQKKQFLNDLVSIADKKKLEIPDIFQKVAEFEKVGRENTHFGLVQIALKEAEKLQQSFESSVRVQFKTFLTSCKLKVLETKEATLKYIKNINESTEYSPEEFKFYKNILEKILKELLKQLKPVANGVRKEENNILKKTKPAFDSAIALLSAVCEELWFNLKVNDNVKECRNTITQLSKEFLADFELYKYQTQKLTNLTTKKKVTKQEDFDKIFKILYKNVCNIFYDVQVPGSVLEDISGEAQEEEMLDEERKRSLRSLCGCKSLLEWSSNVTGHVTAVTLQRDVPVLPCQDYKDRLYDINIPPKDSGQYMLNICHVLSSCMVLLQRLGCDFYTKSRNIIRGEIVQPDYEWFVCETLLRFQSYLMQCEQLWLSTMLEFLTLLAKLKSTCNRYIHSTVEQYIQHLLLELSQCQKTYRSELQTIQTETIETLEALEQKLLPLHGYPKNRELLHELQEKVVVTTSRLGEDERRLFTNYKMLIRSYSQVNVQEKTWTNKMKQKFARLEGVVFNPRLGGKLLDRTMELVERGAFVPWKPYDNVNEIRPPLPEPKPDVKKKGKAPEPPPTVQVPYPDDEVIMQNSEILPRHKLDLPQNNSTQLCQHNLRLFVELERKNKQKERNDSIQEKRNEDEDVSELSAVSVAEEVVNYNLLLDSTLVSLQDLFTALQRSETNPERQADEFIHQWLSIWKFNVRKVRKLYSVKYPSSSRKTMNE